MISPSTPSPARRCSSSASLTVHTWSARPSARARSTSERSTSSDFGCSARWRARAASRSAAPRSPSGPTTSAVGMSGRSARTVRSATGSNDEASTRSRPPRRRRSPQNAAATPPGRSPSVFSSTLTMPPALASSAAARPRQRRIDEAAHRRSGELRVVVDDELAAGRAPRVELDAVGAQREREPERLGRVLRRRARRSPVGQYEGASHASQASGAAGSCGRPHQPGRYLSEVRASSGSAGLGALRMSSSGSFRPGTRRVTPFGGVRVDAGLWIMPAG